MERGTMGRDRPIAKTTAKARKRLVRSGGSVQVLAQAGARRPLGEAGGLQPDSLAGKRPPLAVEGRTMIANEGYGVLSTNSSMYPGYPAAATVALAADAEGRPVFSFSNLSNHAADVARDGRVSLSVVRGNLTAPDEPRVNLVGRIRRLAPEEEDDARELYLQKHPEAWWTRSVPALRAFAPCSVPCALAIPRITDVERTDRFLCRHCGASPYVQSCRLQLVRKRCMKEHAIKPLIFP